MFYFISLIITFSVSTVNAADVVPPANPADAVIIGDRVFLDVNSNGIQDSPVVPDLILGGPSLPGDPGFAFATIQLLNSSDQLVNETTSDVFGNFAFRTDSVGNLLPPDTYRLQFVLPAGMNFTTQGAGGDVNLDSDANTTNGQSAQFTLVAGQHDISIDAGFTNPATACSVANNDIGGNVFRDFNLNGDFGAAEAGFGGVLIEAYDESNTLVASTTSLPDGTYNFPGLAASGAIRLELSGLPGFVESGAAGGNAGSLVQHITAPTCGAHAAVGNPAQFCQVAPNVASTVQNNGDSQTGNSAGNPALKMFGYNSYGVYSNPQASGTFSLPALPQSIATASDLGSAWGMAYHKPTNQIFVSAVMKRHSTFGPLGTGGIYIVDLDAAGSPTTSNFLDLNQAPINTGTDVHDIPAGANLNTPSRDAAAFDAVGKSSLGDMDLSEDNQTLWVVNLADKTLLEIPVGLSATAPTINQITAHTIPDPQCTNGSFRPFGLEIHDGLVYVGGVCDAQGIGGSKADLDVFIFTHDPSGPDSAFTEFIEVNVGFDRGCASTFDQGATGAGCDGFQPWISTWDSTSPSSPVEVVGFYTHPQPMLTDIEIDIDGSLVLALADRFALQAGYQNYDTATSTALRNSVSGGDIMRICNVDGSFIVEGFPGCQNPTRGGVGNGSANGEGNDQPGADLQEYYFDDVAPSQSFNFHQESGMGGLAILNGSGEIMTTVTDPLNVWSGGVSWLNIAGGFQSTSLTVGGLPGTVGQSVGNTARRYQLFEGRTGVGNQDQPITGTGKNGGLGDLEVFCNLPPLSIGNYVWKDRDADGIQDPAEPGMVGVEVQLFVWTDDGDGIVEAGEVNTAAPVSTAFTDVNGSYYFGHQGGNAAGTADANPNDNLGFVDSQGLDPNSKYMVVIDPGSMTNTPLLAGHQSSPVGGTVDSNATNDVHDSDGDTTLLTNLVVVPVMTGNPGENVHTYDFGFIPPLSIGSTVFFDNNNDGTQGAGEAGIENVTVKLFDETGTTEINVGPDGMLGTADDAAGGMLTNSSGDYLFTGLDVGNYIVKVTAPASAPLSSTDIATTTLDNDIDGDDNGVQTASGDEAVSPVIALLGGTEPSNGSGANDEKDTGPNTTGDNQDDSSDADGNMTVDFGFVPSVSLGSTVFSDDNNNSVQDGTETGIIGVTVKLFASNGTTEINVGPDGILGTGDDAAGGMVTNASGDYLFTGLLPGSYIVKVTPPVAIPLSSTDIASSALDNNIDGDDNGAQASSGADAISPIIVLLAGSEPSNGTGATDEKDAGANVTGDNQDDAADTSGNMTVDFGFVPPVSLGSTVFSDDNNNSVQDGSETGISGVTVKLFASNGTTEINVGPDGILGTGDDAAGGMVTNASGDYLFTGLTPGSYIVKVTPPAAAPLSSTDIASTTADNDIDGDDNGVQASSGADAISPIIVLTAGTEPSNGTGANDEKDAGANTTGDNQDDAVDADGNMTVDFGFVPPVSLGSTVFSDDNNNGTHDGSEAGISGVTVKLFASNGTTEIIVGPDGILGTADDATGGMVTNASGDYLFTGLLPGSYIVKVTPPAAAPLSSTDITTSTADNDIDGDDNGVQASSGADAISPVIVLTAGTEPSNGSGVNDEKDAGANVTGDNQDDSADADGNMTVDFGFVPPVSLGSTVFSDDNNNGTQDGSEAGLSGVTVKLFASNGTTEINVGPDGVLGTGDDAAGGMLTNGTGDYLFTGLPPGSYIVKVTAPTTAPLSSTDIATTTIDNDIDGDDNGVQAASGAEAISPIIVLTPGTEPSNGTGANDEKDTGTNTTGDNQDDSADANGNMTVDFGFVPPLSLGSTVFSDDNNNATQDGSEAGISGVTVKLFASNGSTEITVGPDGILGTGDDATGGVVTNATGDYLFTGLLPGSYIVKVTAPSVAPTSSTDIGSSTADNDVDGDDNGTQAASGDDAVSPLIVLSVGTEPSNGTGANDEKDAGANTTGDNQDDSADANGNMTVDFGFVPAVSLGSTVFSDDNNNATQDGSEAGLSGVTVKLFASDGSTEITVGPDGILGTADDATGGVTTDSEGDYLFTGLLPDSYIVKVTAPTAAPLSSTDIGSSSADNDIDGDDNGTQAASGDDAVSPLIVLAVGAEPSNGAGVNDEKDAGANTTGDNQDDGADANGNMTVDFGFVPSLSLGSTVFSDANNNGTHDGTETGLSGVTVKLFDSTGNTEINVGPDGILGTADDAVGGVVTDSAGDYLFTGLLPDSYIIKVTPPTAAPLSSTDIGTSTADNDIDGDDNGVQASSGADAISPLIVLEVGAEPVNGSGATDEKDAGANTSGDNQDDAIDANGNMTIDFGFVPSLSIGSVVWDDSNSDGLQDALEPTLEGAAVTLLVDDGTGTSTFIPAIDIHGIDVDSQTTLADGLYDFNELPEGDYMIQVKPPAGYVPSPIQQVNADGNVANDSNIAAETAILGTYESGIIELLTGDEPIEVGGLKGDNVDDAADSNGNMTIDFGFVQTASVNGRVWIDINTHNNVDDGINTEQGVVGVMINLIDVGPDGLVGTADDVVVDTTTTGADGLYNFADVTPAQYYVEFEEPTGMTFVTANEPGDDTIDSDADETTGFTDSFVLNPGQVVPNIDAGVNPGAVGDRVWLDVNQNGVQDPGEPGVPGITVDLLDSTGTTIVDTTVTGVDGLYAFNNVAPADYIIEFSIPAQMSVVNQNIGSDDSIDSDIDPNAVDKQIPVTVTSGPGNQTYDAGIEPAFIGNFVWFDSNENGQQDPGEPGIEGVTVELLAADGTTVVQTTITDSNGGYGFAVIPDDYLVRVVTPATASFTTADSGDNASDSDVDVNDGKTTLISVASGDDDQTWDAGIIPATLSGTVLLDLNADGVEDNGEPGIDAVTITLTGTDVFGNTVTLTTQTDSNGDYDFIVLPGTYTITETDPADHSSTGSEPGTVGSTVSDDNTITVILSSGDDSQDNDFLDTNVALISGQVRLDTDADGDVNDTDTGIAGVTITLFDDQGVVDTTQTDSNGNYSFVNVQPGDYTIEETDPAGHISTADVDGANDNSIAVTLPPGGTSTGNDYLDTIDTGVISGQVRLDSDADGDTNDPDTGIAGVTIELLDDTGAVVDTTQTDANGNYSFTNVLPGDYTISETDPANHTSTADVDGVNDNSIAVTLLPGDSSTGNDYLDTVDAGLISGQVRLDSDADGDPGDADTGIPGVTIQLLDDTGTVVDTTQTDGNGNYSFTNVPPGNYTIKETDPASHTSTADSDGANDNTITVTLPAGVSSTGNDYLDTNSTNSAGVTGVVWFDTDKDGVKDPDENGLPGWTIEIIDSNGTPVQSLTTLPDGTFAELNLGVGDFTIRFLTPGGIIVKEQEITLNPGDVAFVPEPIDPAGIIYDEQTGDPVPGAQVFLTTDGTPLPAACLGAGEQGQITAADGAYMFFLNPGADPACPVTDTVYQIQVIPPTDYQITVDNPPQPGVLDADNCTIDAVAGITCEVSDQTVPPITGIPPYYILIDIGVGDPGVFNNHIPLTPPSVVLPPTPNTPVKPIPTLSEWARIMLMVLIGVIALMQQGRRRNEVVKL